MADPDFVYDPGDWEATYTWSDRAQLLEDIEARRRSLNAPIEIATLMRGPSLWVAHIVISRDEVGDPDETELRWFATLDEANAAIAAGAKAEGT